MLSEKRECIYLLEIVKGTINENHEHKGRAESLYRIDGQSGGNDGPNYKGNCCTDSRDKIDGSSPDSIDEERYTNVHNQTPRLEPTVNTELKIGIGHARVVHDHMQIVRDETVARPLREESDGGDNTDTLAIAFCSDQVQPAILICLPIKGDRSSNFGVLELNELVIHITLCVVVGEKLKCLILPSFIYKPSRRFRNPVHDNDDND